MQFDLDGLPTLVCDRVFKINDKWLTVRVEYDMALLEIFMFDATSPVNAYECAKHGQSEK